MSSTVEAVLSHDVYQVRADRDVINTVIEPDYY